MKRALCAFLILALLLPLCLTGADAAEFTLSLKGSPIDCGGAAPYVVNGIPMIPVEVAAQAMGVIVAKDAATNETLLQLGTKELRLAAGGSTLIVNGSIVQLPTPAVLKGGVLYAPAKELVTGLGGFWTYSGSSFEIDPQTMDYLLVRYEKAPDALKSRIWTEWAAANELWKAGSYAEAIPKYVSVIPGFTRSDSSNKNNSSAALLYGRLAECYARMGAYDMGAAAYSRSSYFCSLTGDPETPQGRFEQARACRTEIALYLNTTDLSLSREQTHNAPYEPERGIVLGYTSTKLGSSDTYPSTSAKAAGMQLIYFNWDEHTVENKLSVADPNKVVELGVQPMQGFSAVSDDEIKAFAQALAASGRKVLVRYANEMNNTDTIPWSAEPAVYRAEFIRFAKILRQYAPNVGLVWAPNFFPFATVDSFYPGDDYVDYVGFSSYVSSYHWKQAEINYGYDVFGDGMKSTRWIMHLDYLYNHYGYKKPILISEGAASYIDVAGGNADVTELAADQLREYYTYLPMRFPNMKYAVYFNVDNPNTATKYMLSSRPALAAAYNAGIADDQYLSDYAQTPDTCYVPFDTITEAETIPDSTQALTAYVRYGNNTQVKAVRYEINGKTTATVTEAPFRATVDFSKYAGKSVTIKVTALDAAGSVLSEKRFQARVRQSPGKSGFYDVPDNKFYSDAVLWAVKHNPQVTSGVDATHFAPNDPCTREQVVTFLWRTAGAPEPITTESPFEDVTKGYYKRAVFWAVEQGITKGTGPTTFGVGGKCTRGEIVTFLWRAAGSPTVENASNPFVDVVKGYYKDPVLWAVSQDPVITKGVDGTHFNPSGVCSRAEVVTFLYRAKDLLFQGE